MVTRLALTALLLQLANLAASAQSLGTFSWQLQPYCNVISVSVTGVAGVYTLEGSDDQCGAATRAPLTGVATPNPDGTLGFGMHLVTSPGGHGVQVEARLSLATLGGHWSDSDGHRGTFAFGQRTGGPVRPVPTPVVIPPVFGLRTDGGFVASGTRGVGTIPTSGPGPRMMWFPKRAAFRAGSTTGTVWDEPRMGEYSAAFGDDTTASGDASTALGRNTVATGITSVAMGLGTFAPGHQSLAAGFESQAQGNESVALGYQSSAGGQAAMASGIGANASGVTGLAHGFRATASGANSVAIGGDSTTQVGVYARGSQAIAIGSGLTADGPGSVVLGTNAATHPASAGTFVFGDRSTPNSLSIVGANIFAVRAAGGSVFYSNPAGTTGVQLAAGASAWSSLSDANSKERYEDFDDDGLLEKLAAMPVRTWSYKAQDSSIRHAGPTAQDFYAAFGLGEDPLRISTIDADGIALAGVRALVLKQRALENELEQLRDRLLGLERAAAQR